MAVPVIYPRTRINNMLCQHNEIYCDVIINADLCKAGTISVLLLRFSIAVLIFCLHCTFDFSCIFVDPFMSI